MTDIDDCRAASQEARGEGGSCSGFVLWLVWAQWQQSSWAGFPSAGAGPLTWGGLEECVWSQYILPRDDSASHSCIENASKGSWEAGSQAFESLISIVEIGFLQQCFSFYSRPWDSHSVLMWARSEWNAVIVCCWLENVWITPGVDCFSHHHQVMREGGAKDKMLLRNSLLLKDGMVTGFFPSFFFLREERTLTDHLENTFLMAHWLEFFFCVHGLVWFVKWRFRTGTYIAFNLTTCKTFRFYRFCVLEAILSLGKILKGPNRLLYKDQSWS